ncbi:MAG TPA: phospholipase D-like domain-containing protein, partial [Chloroflexota bacterium]|nr:phospholipase D-like domain-containing protein [Chloroflexota bacterium]
REALRIVRAAGIPVVADERRAIMHHKFAVVDGQRVLTGSWNFTVGDTYRLNNNAVIFRVPQLAANYSAEFEKMFVQRRFGPTKPKDIPYPEITVDGTRIETYFAAEVDPTMRLVEVLLSARERIDFLAFSFTQDDVGKAMLDRGRAGVKVRGVFERTGSETRFSEFGPLREAGLEVYQDANPYIMHHKVIVVDGRITVFGSFNFSNNAAEDNDENLLIVHSPEFARAFLSEVDRVVAAAKAGPPARRQ